MDQTAGQTRKISRDLAIPLKDLFPRSYLDSVRELSADPEGPHVVVLVHGTASRGSWFMNIERDLRQYPGGENIVVKSIRYERVSRINAVVCAMTGSMPVSLRRSYRELLSIYRQHNVSRVSIIAHSLGAYVIARMLEHHPEVRLHNVILCGSVIKPSYPWDEHQDRIGALVNDCGQKDWVPVWSDLTCYFGHSGRWGFHSPAVKNRFFKGVGHSDFFTEKFPIKYWAEILINGSVLQPIEGSMRESIVMNAVSKVGNIFRVVCVTCKVRRWWNSQSPAKI